VRVRKFMMNWCLAATLAAFLHAQTMSVEPVDAPSPGGNATTRTIGAPVTRVDLDYVQPSQSTMLHNYLWETFGPYPVGGAMIVGSWNEFNDAVPEWGRGVAGFGRRFGSDFGTATLRTTMRFALAEALDEDTLYYQCQCTGFFPRTGHAITSTLTARRGADGHRVLSFPALAAPYASATVSVYGWYPARYSAKDGFRMGNYSLLAYKVGNIGLEFVRIGPDSLFKRLHFCNAHKAPDSETEQ
jgi:hypothetical protein